MSSSRPSTSDAATRRSRLPVKSQTNSRQSQSLSRGSQKKSLERNVVRSKSTLGEQFRLSRQRSGSLLKQTTPLTNNIAKSVGKSPLTASARKETRPVNDKRWQYEQLVKVKKFVASYLPEIDHNNIKTGMSLDTFIMLTGRLFGMIDKRLVINRENYMEEIPSNLKMFNYPTLIKQSLMKSVNTTHSWPSVIAILSWLTDIIYKINETKEDENELFAIVENCVLQLFLKHFSKQGASDSSDPIQEMDAELVKYFNIDEKALEAEEKELEALQATKESYKEREMRNNEEIKILRNKLESITTECDQYMECQKEREVQIVEKTNATINNIKKLDEELEQLRLTEENLKITIANQPHTLAEKQQLMAEIEELQNILKLKQERCQQQSELVHSLDHQLCDIRQNLQSNAYNYNNIISQLELNDNNLKELHIPESGFMKADTKDKLQKIEALLRIEIVKAKDDTKAVEVKIHELTEKYKITVEKLKAVNKELEEMLKTEKELELLHEHKSKKAILEKDAALERLNTLQNELMQLKSQRPKIEDLEKEIEDIQQQRTEVAKNRHDLQRKAVMFFDALDAQITNNIKEYMKIMLTVTESCVSTNRKLNEECDKRMEFFLKAKEEVAALKKAAN